MKQKKHSPLPNHPPGDGLIDFGLTSFVKVFLYRSQAYALRASDRFLTRYLLSLQTKMFTGPIKPEGDILELGL